MTDLVGGPGTVGAVKKELKYNQSIDIKVLKYLVPSKTMLEEDQKMLDPQNHERWETLTWPF